MTLASTAQTLRSIEEYIYAEMVIRQVIASAPVDAAHMKRSHKALAIPGVAWALQVGCMCGTIASVHVHVQFLEHRMFWFFYILSLGTRYDLVVVQVNAVGLKIVACSWNVLCSLKIDFILFHLAWRSSCRRSTLIRFRKSDRSETGAPQSRDDQGCWHPQSCYRWYCS